MAASMPRARTSSSCCPAAMSTPTCSPNWLPDHYYLERSRAERRLCPVLFYRGAWLAPTKAPAEAAAATERASAAEGMPAAAERTAGERHPRRAMREALVEAVAHSAAELTLPAAVH